MCGYFTGNAPTKQQTFFSPLMQIVTTHKKNLSQTSSLRMSNTKSTISQKLKVAQKKSRTQKSVSKHCASFETLFFVPYLVGKNTWKFWAKSIITQKKKSENWFFIRFSILRIFHENVTISEGGGSAYPYLGQGLTAVTSHEID